MLYKSVFKSFCTVLKLLLSLYFAVFQVGTGFSYCENEAGYVNSEEEMAEQLYKAILGVYAKHPKLTSNPLYLTGL